MGNHRSAARLLSLVVCAAFVALALTSSASAAVQPQSTNVALIPNGTPSSGGTLPLTFPGYFPAFNNVTLESIRDDATDPLTAYDTAVLVRVCDIADWLGNAQFKSRIESFVFNGGKLLVWDTECQNTDYGQFVYPFTTSNPGAQGKGGSDLIDVEQNILGSDQSTSPYYVFYPSIATDYDAVGDGNVFTSFNQNWCVDLKSTNVLQVTGPIQAYAHYGSGLIVYNGMDVDPLGSDWAQENPPNSFDFNAGGAANEARLWMFGLQTPTDGSGLPCGVKVFGLTLDPKTAQNPVGTSHTVTATLFDNGEPKAGVEVKFEIVSGPNQGQTGSGITDTAGKTQFTYTSNGNAGTDTIKASAQLLGTGERLTTVSETATKDWIAPPPPPAAAAAEPAPGPAPEQIVLPARISSGTAKLTSRTGCVHSAFTARVSGRSIKSVTFRLDGKVLSIARRAKNTSYSTSVAVKGLKVGAHTLTADVKFVGGSGTASRRLRSHFSVCAAQVKAPAFTG